MNKETLSEFQERYSRECVQLTGAIALVQRTLLEATEATRIILEQAESYSKITPDAMGWDAAGKHMSARVDLDKHLRDLGFHFYRAKDVCTYTQYALNHIGNIMPPLRLVDDSSDQNGTEKSL